MTDFCGKNLEWDQVHVFVKGVVVVEDLDQVEVEGFEIFDG